MIPASSRRRAIAVSRSARTPASRPWRGWPRESNPPALISDSMVRLFRAGGIDPLAEVVEVGERAALVAAATMWRDHAFADVAHRRHAEVDRRPRRRRRGPRRTEKSDSDSLTSGTSTEDAELAALVEEHRGLVLVRLHAGEQRGEVLDRVVRLQVCGLVREEPVADGVRLVERVVGERLDGVEHLARRTARRGPARRSRRRTSSAPSRSARASSCRWPCAGCRPLRASSPRAAARRASAAPGRSSARRWARGSPRGRGGSR